MANTRPRLFDAPFFPTMMKAMSVAHVALFRLTRGRVGSTYRFGSAFPRGIPACLLTTRGRRTGRARTSALVYLPDGERVVLIASRVGTPVHPQWYLNLRADPEVIIETFPEGRRTMRARTAEGRERADLWVRVVALHREYASFESWTDRVIPVVVCEPVSG
ncbi:MAG: nitroreductase family deazaflavin-dependent oxidoreductase [Zavarzinella sp.]|nr:nitroreductase family deazaflavin-dependent oxidoreductase [Zavarzinella sp.]